VSLQSSESESVRPLERQADSLCFGCGPDKRRGLRLNFAMDNSSAMAAEWIPDSDLEGFRGVTHGGLVSTALDESMAKVVAATGIQALTAELKVRFRQQVSTGVRVCVRGWIESRDRRVFLTEAALTAPDGAELAHAWAKFLVVR